MPRSPPAASMYIVTRPAGKVVGPLTYMPWLVIATCRTVPPAAAEATGATAMPMPTIPVAMQAATAARSTRRLTPIMVPPRCLHSAVGPRNPVDVYHREPAGTLNCEHVEVVRETGDTTHELCESRLVLGGTWSRFGAAL